MSIAIKEKASDAVLAEGEEGRDVMKFEGNWYFQPGAIDASVLVTTDRTYTCPMKGTCNWVDYVGPDGRTVKDVAWVYPKTKPGYEQIAGRFAFYAEAKGGTRQAD